MTSESQSWMRHFNVFRNKRKPATEAAAKLEAQEACYLGLPNPQTTIELADCWLSKFPAELDVTAGSIALFEDGRADWAFGQMGGLSGKSVLELGPLEAGHTYMLERAGAASILAIEANKASFIKCLIAKELLGLTKARFLLGNFSVWLDQNRQAFDVAWLSGVLYHMDAPGELLRQVAAVTNTIYIWTHYVPDEYREDEEWAQSILRVEDRQVGGRLVPHYVRTYHEVGKDADYIGGVFTTSCWLRRSDILAILRDMGFGKIETDMDVRHHQNGPCFHLVASKFQPTG